VCFVRIVFFIPTSRVSEFDIIPQTLSNYVTLFEASSEILNLVFDQFFMCLELLGCALILVVFDYCEHKVFVKSLH
jgi:hypothetical protein